MARPRAASVGQSQSQSHARAVVAECASKLLPSDGEQTVAGGSGSRPALGRRRCWRPRSGASRRRRWACSRGGRRSSSSGSAGAAWTGWRRSWRPAGGSPPPSRGCVLELANPALVPSSARPHLRRPERHRHGALEQVVLEAELETPHSRAAPRVLAHHHELVEGRGLAEEHGALRRLRHLLPARPPPAAAPGRPHRLGPARRPPAAGGGASPPPGGGPPRRPGPRPRAARLAHQRAIPIPLPAI